MTGIAYAALSLAGAALIGLITFAVLNSRARDQREAARVLASSTAGELVRAKDAIERLTQNLKSEQERADALDDELAKTYDVPDPAGARDRVLARWKTEHDSARGRTVALPTSVASKPAGPDDLLNPFTEG
jgi:hypothetical protein